MRKRKVPEAAYSCQWCGRPLNLFELVLTAEGERVCKDECLAGTLFEGRDRSPAPEEGQPCGSWYDLPE